MKKTTNLFSVFMMMLFLFPGVITAQEVQLTHNGTGFSPMETIRDDGGEWIKYWDTGVNDNAIGLGPDAATWHAAIRWMPDDLGAYQGYGVTKIRIFMNDEPDGATAMIWQGNINNPNIMVSQPMEVAEEDWVEVELPEPYLIDTTQELWVGWAIEDPGEGFFPAACEDSNQHDQLANLLQFGTNPWNFASAFGLDAVWNIEAYVAPLESYAVTFNVDMSDAEGFNPNRHTVYLTGSFTGWAEPGTTGSIVMSPSDQDLIFTATVDIPSGHHEYKYFSDFVGAGWDGGEWPGDPNRVINVTGDMTVDDVWGVIPDPVGPYQVTFNVNNQAGQPVQNALIKVFTGNGKATPSEPVLLTRSNLANEYESRKQTISDGHLPELSNTTTPGTKPDYREDDTGQWIKYWNTGVNDNALGLGGDGATWYAAIRWMPANLIPYQGYGVSKIRVFMNDEPLDATAMIWQGNINNPTMVVSEPMMVAEEDWVEVVLPEPYIIDITQELWIGWEINDPGDGVFPAAFETSSQHDGLANLLQFGDNPWQFASAFGFQTVWNIEAYVVQLEEVDYISLVTNANGQASFEADPGFYAYTVEKEGHFDAAGNFEVVNSPLNINVLLETEEEIPEYSVTFNLDMSDVEGFDPEEHTVYLTGTFTNWAEPGTEGSIEMVQGTPPILYETFQNGQIPDGWLNLDEDGDGEKWFIVPANHNPVVGNYAIASASWMPPDNPLTPDNWLITPQITNVNDDYVLSFYVKAQDPTYPHEKYDVLISTTGTNPTDFTSVWSETLNDGEWLFRTIDLADFEGEDIYIAFRHWDSNDWFRIVLDAIKVEGTPADKDKSFFYYATVSLAEGSYEYKYFSDAFGDGWDGGEWIGDPNREIQVTGPMVVNDVWGVIDPDPDPDPEPTQTISFNVSDDSGMPLNDAMITVYPGGQQADGKSPVMMNRGNGSLNTSYSYEPKVINRGHGEHMFQVAPHTTPGQPPSYNNETKTGFWKKYWKHEVNENALGLNVDETTSWFAAIRWMPEDLELYQGYAVTKIRVFINDEPEYGYVTIWQGDIDNPTVMLQQEMTLTEEGWVEVDLSDPYFIDTNQELWIGWEIGDPGEGVFPAAFEISDEYHGLSDLLQFGDNPWNPAADFGFDVVWNIEAFVEPLDVEPIVLFTDNDGNASFEALPGYYTYTVEKEGYLPADGEFNVANQDININVTMEPFDPGEYTITFNIVDEFEDPVDDAVVTLGGITNPAGDYVFEDVPHGMHSYTVTRLCYHSSAGEILINQEETITIMLELNIMHGDANGDGVVNILDIITVSSFWGTQIPPSNWCFHNADINSDGIINILDIIGISNIWAGGN